MILMPLLIAGRLKVRYSDNHSQSGMKFLKQHKIEITKYSSKAVVLAYDEFKNSIEGTLRSPYSGLYSASIAFMPVELYYKYLEIVKKEVDFDLHDYYFDRDDESEIIERKLGEQWIDHGVLVECCESRVYSALLDKCENNNCHFKCVSTRFWKNCKLKCYDRSDKKEVFAKRIKFKGE